MAARIDHSPKVPASRHPPNSALSPTNMHSFIERLEPRIAPAALAGNVLNYTDIDGDAVTITFATRGTLQASDFVFEASDFAENGPQQLDAILIPKGHKWKGTDLSAVATAGGEGDGEVHIRRIDARGVDLGNVFVDGDLGAIRAGDHRRGTFAVETLDIATWGGNAIASTALDQSPTSPYISHYDIENGARVL